MIIDKNSKLTLVNVDNGSSESLYLDGKLIREYRYGLLACDVIDALEISCDHLQVSGDDRMEWPEKLEDNKITYVWSKADGNYLELL